jgi:hypothetical protein
MLCELPACLPPTCIKIPSHPPLPPHFSFFTSSMYPVIFYSTGCTMHHCTSKSFSGEEGGGWVSKDRDRGAGRILGNTHLRNPPPPHPPTQPFYTKDNSISRIGVLFLSSHAASSCEGILLLHLSIPTLSSFSFGPISLLKLFPYPTAISFSYCYFFFLLLFLLPTAISSSY